MKRAFFFALFFVLFGSIAGHAQWITGYKDALALAKAQKKNLLLNFTGSDWCPWCIKLKEEVFTKQEFLDYAKTNLVLVEVDFPENTQLPKELEKGNKRLQRKYNVESFPTLVLLNSKGKKLGTTGYVAGGPSAFLAELEKIKTPKPSIWKRLFKR